MKMSRSRNTAKKIGSDQERRCEAFMKVREINTYR